MKKRKTDQLQTYTDEVSPAKMEERIDKALLRMRHKDLVIACISRGAPFEELANWDHHGLASFFRKNFDRGEDPKLLIEYDVWREDYLRSRGYKNGDAMLSPLLRLGFTGDLNQVEGPVLNEPHSKTTVPIVPVEKKVREKDLDTGVVAGTKKNLTYQLANQKPILSIDQIIKMVKEKFSEAQDKSIKIWVKRARASKNDKDDD